MDPSIHVTVADAVGVAKAKGLVEGRIGGFAVKLAMVDGTDVVIDIETLERTPAAEFTTPMPPPEVGFGMQYQPPLQAPHAQPNPQGALCGAVCEGEQNHPSGHSEQEYPAFGQG